jgi:hypothetical protein
MKKSILAVLFVLLSSSPALCEKQFVSGKQLLVNCESGVDYAEGNCTGYISGVFDNSPIINKQCLPQNATAGKRVKSILSACTRSPQFLFRLPSTKPSPANKKTAPFLRRP